MHKAISGGVRGSVSRSITNQENTNNVPNPSPVTPNEKNHIRKRLRNAFKALRLMSLPIQLMSDTVQKSASLGNAAKSSLKSLGVAGQSIGIVFAPLDACSSSEAAAAGDVEKATFIGAVSATSATMSVVGLLGMGALSTAMLPVVTGLDFAREVYSTLKIRASSQESVNIKVEIPQDTDPKEEITNLKGLRKNINELIFEEKHPGTLKDMEIEEFKSLLRKVPSELKDKLLELKYGDDINPLRDDFGKDIAQDELTDQNESDIHEMRTNIIGKLPKINISNIKIEEFKSLLSKVPSELKDKLLESRYGNDINHLLNNFSINITEKNLTDQNITDIKSYLTERVKTEITGKLGQNIDEKQNALDTNRKNYLKKY